MVTLSVSWLIIALVFFLAGLAVGLPVGAIWCAMNIFEGITKRAKKSMAPDEYALFQKAVAKFKE